MKKLQLTIFALFLTLSLFIPSAIQAQSTVISSGDPFGAIPCITKYCTLSEAINVAASIIRPAFILTFLAMILYGAWVRMTSAGNPEKIKSSSQIIVAAIIGFGIAVLAPTVSDFMLRLLGEI